MKLTMRPIRPEDKQDMLYLMEKTWELKDLPFSFKEKKNLYVSILQDTLQTSSYCRGVFRDEQMVGFLLGKIIKDTSLYHDQLFIPSFDFSRDHAADDKNTIDLFVIKKEFQNQSIGSMMLDHFEKACLKANRFPIEVHTDSLCTWKFYERRGYRKLDKTSWKMPSSQIIQIYSYFKVQPQIA